MKQTLEGLRERCVISEDGCWLWRGDRYTNGNPRVNEEGKRVPTKRLALRLAGRREPDQYGSARCCESGDCINPDHLKVYTRQQVLKKFAAQSATSRVRVLKSIVARRKAAPKGSIQLAREIRASSESAKDIAARHGYDVATVRAIRAGRQWRELDTFSLGARP